MLWPPVGTDCLLTTLFCAPQAIDAMVKLRFHPGKDVLARVAARAGLRTRGRPHRTAQA